MKIQTSFLLIFLASNIYAQDLRNVAWGMNHQTVSNIETLPLFKRLNANQNNFALLYEDYIFGDSIRVVYQFLYDSLQCIVYEFKPSVIFSEPFTHLNKYLESITTKYGSPKEVSWNTSDPKAKDYVDRAKDKDTELSMMIFDGTIQSVLYKWETKTTNICLGLYGSKITINNQNVKAPMMSIFYQSKQYDYLVEKAQREYANNKL